MNESMDFHDYMVEYVKRLLEERGWVVFLNGVQDVLYSLILEDCSSEHNRCNMTCLTLRANADLIATKNGKTMLFEIAITLSVRM
jgi:hypothetical protein